MPIYVVIAKDVHDKVFLLKAFYQHTPAHAYLDDLVAGRTKCPVEYEVCPAPIFYLHEVELV